MILEAVKIASSIWPLLKEVFLWRDGAEVGKPITNQNLIRRKIAVFALLGSIIFNYFVTGKAVELYKQNTAYKAQIEQLQQDLKTKQDNPPACIKQEDLRATIRAELEACTKTQDAPKRKRKTEQHS